MSDIPGQTSRAMQIGTISFAVAGGGFGVCYALLYRRSPLEPGNVHLDESVPLAIGGMMIGFVVGWILHGCCAYWPRLQGPITVIATALLVAAFTGPLGWSFGDMISHGRLNSEGLVIGAILGAAAGLAMGLIQLAIDREDTKTTNRDRRS